MKILSVFGTRPEAIKMCPLVKELRKRDGTQVLVCLSGQHRQMLDSVMERFGIKADFDLDVMIEGQTLFDLTESILSSVRSVLESAKPDVVLVHGDTATAHAAALAAFYMKIPVGHIEAGLRTYDASAPFPEEFYRRAISVMAKFHFAPTATAAENLIREGIDNKSVFVTGNTAIDALLANVTSDFSHPILSWAHGSRLVILTAHRRESVGIPLGNMLLAVRRVLDENSGVKVVYPVHLNPEIRRTADLVLGGCDNIMLTEPLDVFDFHNILARSFAVLTDSGGIQEEASFLGKPTLVMRSATERPEGVSGGVLKLVGTREDDIYRCFQQLIADAQFYKKMSVPSETFGDGGASAKIADILLGKQYAPFCADKNEDIKC